MQWCDGGSEPAGRRFAGTGSLTRCGCGTFGMVRLSTDSATMAYLLKYDSVHGRLDEDVTAREDSIEIDGKSIPIRSVRDPEKIGWVDLCMEILSESNSILRRL